MTAVVTLRPNEPGRHYRLPTDADYAAVRRAQARVAGILEEWERGRKQGLCPVPDEPLPPIGTLGFRVQRYGMMEWGDLFTARQKAALVELGRLTDGLSSGIHQILIALLLGRMADGNNSFARWESGAENPVNLFARQAIPLVWDFSESAPKSNAWGVFLSGITAACKVIDAVRAVTGGQVQQADATDHPLPDQSANVWFTDPPYYDAIPYSDLSDFFLVWLKRALPDHPLLRDPFDPGNPLSPKTREAVQDETKQCNDTPKNRAWFEETMAKSFAEGRRILAEDGVGSVVFAHKTTEGWEALLSGMIRGGWTITGAWPIATEMTSRLRARDSAALATSVHLICRPRPDDAPTGEWAEALGELPLRVADWMERLQGEGVRGANLVFACIGPALEIFSRYRAVETADGREVGLPEYLEKVWEVVGRTALEQVLGTAEAKARNGLAGALEEDARLTALFLWTLQSTAESDSSEDEFFGFAGSGGTGFDQAPFASANPPPAETNEEADSVPAKGYSLPFDVVRRFSQPMGIDLERWAGRIIASEKGVVRLLPVAERAKTLFGTEGSASAADWIEAGANTDVQQTLFPAPDTAPEAPSGRHPGRNALGADAVVQSPDATALDRVHTAMLLQAGGHANALRALIVSEQERGPDFLRLSNALSALYPRGSREKRLLDAMLLATSR